MPEFSIEPGFTSRSGEHHRLQLSRCTVHWTTDGSEPPTSSMVQGAITVDQTTVLKAIAYRAGWLPSVVNSGTYFINVPTKLPVVSLSTHPDSLFDDTLGIYSIGPGTDTVYPNWGANFWEERDPHPFRVLRRRGQETGRSGCGTAHPWRTDLTQQASTSPAIDGPRRAWR